MALCPKCGFNGRNEDQCERCGIIFDKMHTILEVRPLGAIPQPAPRIQLGGQRPQPPRAPDHDAPTVQVDRVALPAQAAPPRVAAALARSAPAEHPPRRLDRDATNLEVPLVPRVAPDSQRPSRLGPIVGVLVAIVAIVGALQWRSARHAESVESAHVENTTDAAYFEVALEGVVADARRSLRSVTEPTAAQFELERTTARLTHLRASLDASALTPDDRAPFLEALEALDAFLARDVPKAIASARELGGRTEPVSSWALSKASAALARARERRTSADDAARRAAEPPPEPAQPQ